MGNTEIKVLVIDDEKNLLDLISLFLSRDPKVSVEKAGSGAEAIEKLEKGDFDVIVSDYEMAGMNGIELLHHLRSQGNDVPFIFLTGRGREQVAMKALNLGADFYIQKSTDLKAQFDKLVETIHLVVAKKREERILKRSEEHYRTLFFAAPVPLLEVDLTLVLASLGSFQGKGEPISHGLTGDPERMKAYMRMIGIIDANEAALAMFGVKALSDLHGEAIMMGTNEVAASFGSIMNSLITGEEKWSGCAAMETGSGKIQKVMIHAGRVKNVDAQDAVRVIFCFTDLKR